MIKGLFVVFILSLSTSVWAKNISLFEIQHKQNKVSHKFTLLQKAGSEKYILKSIRNNKTEMTKLSPQQAKSLQSYVNSIAWEGQYRRPSAMTKCTTYVTIKNTTARANICQEDYSNTGRALGLLNELDRLLLQK